MNNEQSRPIDLQAMARQVMLENGFNPDFGPGVDRQVASIQAQPPALSSSPAVRDLRTLNWSSIDNDTSRDLDQIEVAERVNGAYRVMIGIADVVGVVPKGTPIDGHAALQTTTVYTGVKNFSMLPEVLSTGITSLLEAQDRLSMVVSFEVSSDGLVGKGELFPAWVRNRWQLTYNAVGAWLEDRGPAPPKVAASRDLADQLHLQAEIAHALRQQRFSHGALNIETNETRPVVLNQEVVDVVKQEKNRATELIEDFMIAANGVVARALEGVSSIRRVVRKPERWDRIVQLAKAHGVNLPAEPDSKALNDFLIARKAAEPEHFADLSLAVIKLIGPGEYVLERAGDPEVGHFGLAVEDYTHSTAPNRRFADMVTQRLIKAVHAGLAAPYSDAELSEIAARCTAKEDAARKVERAMSKRVAAVSMSHRIGEVFDAVVTGATPKGTFVRVLRPHVEGLLAHGQEGLDVGDKLKVKLIRTDPQKGYIDFAAA